MSFNFIGTKPKRVTLVGKWNTRSLFNLTAYDWELFSLYENTWGQKLSRIISFVGCLQRFSLSLPVIGMDNFFVFYMIYFPWLDIMLYGIQTDGIVYPSHYKCISSLVLNLFCPDIKNVLRWNPVAELSCLHYGSNLFYLSCSMFQC